MERDVVAVFGAHPDDLDWAAGGTAAVWAKQGREVYYVLTTSGDSGEDHIGRRKLTPAEMADIREAEQRIAASVLGVKEVVFLRLPDGRLEPSLQLRDCLVNVLRRLKPNIVVSLEPAQWPFDNFYLYHPDHRATALALYDAIYPAAGTASYVPEPDAGLPPHRVREVYFSGTANPDTYVDISDYIDLKIQALTSHRSQISDPERLADFVREWASKQGAEAGCAYAEAFRRLEVPQ